MPFNVDVQIHSKYSRATSKNADIDHLALWARKKGITVVGTGDFTHPAWLAEIKEKLIAAEEPGLFRLHPDIEKKVDAMSPKACLANPIRFMMEVEISTIYKKWDKVRKIHHLIFVPDLQAADRLVERLAKIGNIASDGRPILGLDSRNLLEITLETGPHSYLIPAHIWTPWFAALGSKSGFDSIDDCYGDLAEHVFAVETGLSSDPPMNWRISSLDRFRIVSNSDAHSPGKIAREATTYDTELDYFAMLNALKTGEGFAGTIEFFPEEGKYHMDGHRNCNIRFTPEETKDHDGICPVCGKPLTVGVSHRINSLADRSEKEVLQSPPPNAAPMRSLVPLPEILAELKGAGVNSKTVTHAYEKLLETLGPELHILEHAPLDDIKKAGSSLLAEAISRLRQGKVIREPGYDGEYGVIRMFEKEELRNRLEGALLFELPVQKAKNHSSSFQQGARKDKKVTNNNHETKKKKAITGQRKLDTNQQQALEITEGPLLIIAGPGSGKTRTLTHRIAHLVTHHNIPPEQCLAVTFTRRAAAEMKERLITLLPQQGKHIPIHTFHSLGLSILQKHPKEAGLAPHFGIINEREKIDLLSDTLGVKKNKARELLRAISHAKVSGIGNEKEVAHALSIYQKTLKQRNLADFDDLVGLTVQALENNQELLSWYRERYAWLSIDEYQDVDPQQYRLVRLLAPQESNICAIGDPNQAIYGFRGADVSCFHRFEEDYPKAKVIRLARNYRSTDTIIAASSQVITEADMSSITLLPKQAERISVHTAPTERAEAEWVVHSIEKMVGGHHFFSLDSGRAEAHQESTLSFGDFAILYRTDTQSHALVEALHRSGMPFGKHGHGLLAAQPGVQTIIETLSMEENNDDPLSERLKQIGGRIMNEENSAVIHNALQQLVTLAKSCENNQERFLQELTFATEIDSWDVQADRISLLTLHAAKGLEFPVVFMAGMEDGILPLHWGHPDEATIEEERRLCYVGMTRAQEQLFLSRAIQRRLRGKIQQLPPSPYLTIIEQQLIEHSRKKEKPKKEADKQLVLF